MPEHSVSIVTESIPSGEERVTHCSTLVTAASPEEFRTALRWLAEHGMEAELDLLNEIRQRPPFDAEDIPALLSEVEDRIHDRVYDPYRVIELGEKAYQQNKTEWDERYGGKYIAIHRGEVVDADADEDELTRRVMAVQHEVGPFRAYIRRVPDEERIVFHVPIWLQSRSDV